MARNQKDFFYNKAKDEGYRSRAAKELSGGRVVGIDLQKIKPMEGIDTIKGDITKEATLGKIEEMIGEHGDGIAKIDDLVIFVKHGRISQHVRVRIREVHPNFAFADIIEPVKQ